MRFYEDTYRLAFLRTLSKRRSLAAYQDLYACGQGLVPKKYYKSLDQKKIEALSRIHAFFSARAR